MSRSRKQDEDFASTGLVALVVRALRDAAPDLLPSGFDAPDPMKSARIDSGIKRDLLQHIYDERGAGPILMVGQHLEDGDATPILSVLTRGGGPAVLADKWMRLERYHHAVNRTSVRIVGNGFDCRRSSRADPPTPAENALVAGLIVAICRLAGAVGLSLDIDGRDRPADTLGAVGQLRDGGSAFRIAWTAWPDARPEERGDGAGTAVRLKALISSDPGRGWRVADAASMMAMSVRSLQRDLSRDGTAFSSALRSARIDHAGRLLRDPSISLADVGYCCGYADQPHFQRDFLRAVNMTPNEYRALSL